MEPPTSVLPGIKHIATTRYNELSQAVQYLRTIYNPPVRGSRRRKSSTTSHATQPSPNGRGCSGRSNISQEGGPTTTVCPTVESAVSASEYEVLADLRSDPFERSYVIRWLTSVVAQLSGLLEEEEEHGETEGEDPASKGTEEVKAHDRQNRRETERLLADTAALLAVCAGTASAGVICRVFTAHSPMLASLVPPISTMAPPSSPCSSPSEGIGTLSINLRDLPLNNQDYGSVGAQTWGGACVMAEMVVEDPRRFGLVPLQGSDRLNETGSTAPFRILELGAGTGLVSLTIASFYRALFSHDIGGGRDVEIVATDYYPSVLENLEVNLRGNGFGAASHDANAVATRFEGNSRRVSLKSSPLDWSTFSSPALSSSALPSSQPSSSNRSSLNEPFDMVFGADIVYEEQHALWIKTCLKQLLRKPSVGTSANLAEDARGTQGGIETNTYFHLIIPLRSTHTFESGTIETVFKTLSQDVGHALGSGGDEEMDVAILEKQMIVCEVEEGGSEVVYAYYKIGWT